MHLDYPITRYRFDIKVKRDIFFKEYAGSALRGILGHAFLDANPKYLSPDEQQFLAPLLFAPKLDNSNTIQAFSHIPLAYVIEAKNIRDKAFKQNDVFSFYMVLFGDLNQHINLIISAWKQAFLRYIGGGEGELLDVLVCPEHGIPNSIMPETQLQLPHLNIPKILPNNMLLEFITPLRLQQNGKILGVADFSSSQFLMTLLRRFSLISQFHFQQKLDWDFKTLKQQSRDINSSLQLHWQNWQRHSNRQQQSMNLGGVLGNITLLDLPERWQQLLYLGQFIHVGKNTSFGLGHYRITNI